MRIAFAVFALIATAATAHADDDTPKGEAGRPVDKGTFGVGIILGEPTGVCFKLYLKDDQAVQGAVGGAFVTGGIQFHADYVFHPWILQDRDSYVLPAYIGPGVRVISYDAPAGGKRHVAFGLRAVVGLLFDFKNVPLDAFIEVSAIPEYDFGDNKGFGLAFNAGAGVRYYF
jgi:hypothetical protein